MKRPISPYGVWLPKLYGVVAAGRTFKRNLTLVFGGHYQDPLRELFSAAIRFIAADSHVAATGVPSLFHIR